LLYSSLIPFTYEIGLLIVATVLHNQGKCCIRDGKIWLQHNGTENDIAAELIEMGAAKSDTVIGFQSPFKRQFTEYAVS
jgi:XisI protein